MPAAKRVAVGTVGVSQKPDPSLDSSPTAGGPLPPVLQQALLPVVDHPHCTQPTWWGTTVKETMVCAGGDIRAGCNVSIE